MKFTHKSLIGDQEVMRSISNDTCACCGYKKDINRKYKDTKCSNYYGKCDRFLCFEAYHRRNNV